MSFMVYKDASIKQDTTPTKVRIIDPCWIHGEPRKVDEIVTVGRQDAVDLRSMKRVVIVD